MTRFAFLCLGLFLVAAPAAADDVIVVELFTSQGCDKCPPADVLLKDLATSKGVIALDWHVDYWDFMGWKDHLARPEHKIRQQAYNEAMGGKGVVTPQFVINGRDQVTGARKLALYQEVQSALTANDFSLSVRFEGNAGGLKATVEGNAASDGAAIRLVWYDASEKIKISGGANSGKTIEYVNVVLNSKIIGTLKGGRASIPIDLANPGLKGADGLVILVENGAGGPILGAAQLALADMAR